MDAYSVSFFIGLFVVYVALPVAVGSIFYFVPQKLGYPKAGKYLTILYALFVLGIAVNWLFEDLNYKRKIKTSILLADREAPLGWVYLRIYGDSSFEFESRGLGRGGDVYAGKARITADSIFFCYRDSIPKAGSKAVYSDKYVVYTNGEYPETVAVILSKLKTK